MWGRVIVLGSSMILGVGMFLLRIFFQICWHVLFLKKLGFLAWYYLHQKGELGAGIYNSVELFRIGRWKMFVFFLASKFLYAEG